MSAKYSRLPTSDSMEEVKLDFGSPFTYSDKETLSRPTSGNYKSAFTYKDWSPHLERQDARYIRVKQSIFSKIVHWILVCLAVLLIILTCPVSLWFCIKKVKNHERMVVFRLGRLLPIREQDTVFVIPCVDRVEKVDMRIKAFNVPPQQVITIDKGLIEVGADVYYKISSVKTYVTSIRDMNSSLRILVQSTFKNNFLQKTLHDIETDKLSITAEILESSNKTCKDWGIVIHDIQVSQIKVLKKPPENQGGIPGLPAGLPQTFQQLAAAFLQSSASGDASGSLGMVPDPVTVLPDTGAAGVDDALLHNIPTPREFIGVVKAILSESLVNSMKTVYVFQLSGPEGGVFYLDLKHGSGDAGEGLPPYGEPDTTLTLTVADMQAMFVGQLKPLTAYMNGRLKVTGDLSAATQLGDFIKIVMKKVKEDKRDSFIV